MVGFEDDAPTPAVVARCGRVLVQAGPERPDGGPRTEVVEVEPVRADDAPAAADAEEPAGFVRRHPCEKDYHMAVIFRLARTLENAMDAYVLTEPGFWCECSNCEHAEWTVEAFGYLAYQARLIAEEAEQNCHHELLRQARADARDDAAEVKTAVGIARLAGTLPPRPPHGREADTPA